MTRETGLLTNSQEEFLMQEYAEMKDIGQHIDIIDPLQFQFSFNEQLGSFSGGGPPTNEYDDKAALQQNLMMQQEQQQQHQQQQAQQLISQPMLRPIVEKEELAGDYNFRLILSPHNADKHWVYSEKLSKVFIHMEQVLPLRFMWTPDEDGLWVRATMVYKLDQHRSQPVLRCHNHTAPDNTSNTNIDPRQMKHVIRCLHNTSIYEEDANGHLSVLTPLGRPEAGVQNVPMDFKFYCKNSCTSGMNRRPTEIIFTLETGQNVVLGRRRLEVRVCSCPKRDKEKEESEMDASKGINSGSSKKRKMMTPLPGLPPPGKKLSIADTQVYPLHLNIVGRENLQAVIKYAHDVMAGSAIRSGNYELYRPYMDEALRKAP